MKKKLIVHADDFNLTRGVSRGIIKAHRTGVVTSTSIMVNGAGLAEAVALLRSCPKLDVGLHVTLSWGRPISPIESVPSLVDQRGNFWLRHDTREAKPAELLSEVEAQFQALVRSGIHPSHLDSHHYLQDDPLVLEAMMTVAAREGLAMRSTGESMRRTLAERGIRCPVAFIGGFYDRGNVSLDNFLELLSNLPEGISEINCHPGEVDQDLPRVSSYVEMRARELEVLVNPEIRPGLEWLELELAGYGDL